LEQPGTVTRLADRTFGIVTDLNVGRSTAVKLIQQTYRVRVIKSPGTLAKRCIADFTVGAVKQAFSSVTDIPA
jgi:hypothetical protein